MKDGIHPVGASFGSERSGPKSAMRIHLQFNWILNLDSGGKSHLSAADSAALEEQRSLGQMCDVPNQLSNGDRSLTNKFNQSNLSNSLLNLALILPVRLCRCVCRSLGREAFGGWPSAIRQSARKNSIIVRLLRNRLTRRRCDPEATLQLMDESHFNTSPETDQNRAQ